MVWTAEEDDLETTTTGLADPFDGRFPARLLDNTALFDWTSFSEPLVDAVHPRSLWDAEQQDEAAPPDDEGADDGSLGLMCVDGGHDARGCHTSLPSHSSCSHDAHEDDELSAELLMPCLRWEEGHDAREDEDDDIRTACRAIRPPIEPIVESEDGDGRHSQTGSIPCPPPRRPATATRGGRPKTTVSRLSDKRCMH